MSGGDGTYSKTGWRQEPADAFFRYWVLKESFMKAVRLGMKLDTRKFEIEFDKEDHPVLVKKAGGISGKIFL